MANLPFFWQSVVVVLIISGLAYLLSLGITIYYAKDSVDHDVTWDENLKEGQAPVPSWWFWSGIMAAIFALTYMAFYPSFGNYKGLFDDAFNTESYAKSKKKFKHDHYQKLNKLKKSNLATLQLDVNAMNLASNIFAQNCASCHTSNAKGQTNFPNLKDDSWIWGGSPKQITHSITNGRKAMMPSWNLVLKGGDINKVANYVKSVSNNNYDEDKHGIGKQKYQQICSGCHGKNLQGNPMLGAPNLGDNAWIYGGDIETIKTSIRSGRKGIMPAHKDKLTPLQIKLLVAWLTKDT